jgi:hypothetical protein
MRLYKYFKWDRAKEVLLNNTLWFADLFHQNDVLESVIMFDKQLDVNGIPLPLPRVIYQYQLY